MENQENPWVAQKGIHESQGCSWVSSRRNPGWNLISLWKLPGTGIFGSKKWCQRNPEIFLQFWQQGNVQGMVSMSPKNSSQKKKILKNHWKKSELQNSSFWCSIFPQNSTWFGIFFPLEFKIFKSAWIPQFRPGIKHFFHFGSPKKKEKALAQEFQNKFLIYSEFPVKISHCQVKSGSWRIPEVKYLSKPWLQKTGSRFFLNEPTTGITGIEFPPKCPNFVQTSSKQKLGRPKTQGKHQRRRKSVQWVPCFG